MFEAIKLRNKNDPKFHIPSARTIYRIMKILGLSHRPRRNPHGITKADRKARKSEDLLKRNFYSEKPLTKCITDISEIKARNGKLYVSVIFDCFDTCALAIGSAIK